MPFKSPKQRRFLFKNKPSVAEKFARDSKKSSGRKAPKRNRRRRR